MADIIDEEVELHLIDTRQLVKEAKKLKEAKRIAEQSKKVKKQLTFGGPSQSIQAGQQGLIPGADAKRQTRIGAVKGQNTFNAFRESQKKIKDLERSQKQVKKQVNKINVDIINKMKGAQSLLSSGSGIGTAGSILSRFGPIGMIVAAIAIPLITEIQKSYQRGGALSVFLKEKIQAKTIIDEDELNQARSGNKFLTSDLRVVQGEPRSSNTQNIKYEHIRFTAQTLGQ